MFLDLRTLALRGGDHYERTYPLDLAPIVLGGARYEVLAPEGVTVGVDRVVGGFLIDIFVPAKVYGPCARCLSEAVLEVDAREQEFVPTAKDGWEESELSPFVAEMVLDIAGIAREAVVLSLPALVVCSPECKGLCPRCGQDLNRGSCECVPAQSDERWGQLKNIKLDD